MPIANIPYKTPEEDVVVLETVDGVQIRDWLSYRCNSHFLTPTDSFSFQVAGDMLTDSEKVQIVPGAQVRLSVNGHTQASGYIDQIGYSSEGGTVLSFECRDLLSPAVDACADPTLQFKRDMTLEDVLIKIFAPYGFASADKFETLNDTNLNVITGQKRGHPTSKRGKPLKSYESHLLRPYPHEGCFSFASRICQRFGLWIWLSADGGKIIVSKPIYDPARLADSQQRSGSTAGFTQREAPGYSLRRTIRGDGNILHGHVTKNIAEQPSFIVAEGYSGGNGFGKAQLRTFCANPAIDAPGVKEAETFWKSQRAVIVDMTYVGAQFKSKISRPLYLQDSESKTQEQLNAFTKREMSKRLRHTLECHYTVEGHVDDRGNVWAIDTLVDVVDELAGLRETLWVLSRTFYKSRSGGTTTEIELIRPNTLDF